MTCLAGDLDSRARLDPPEVGVNRPEVEWVLAVFSMGLALGR
jgi:hypothetical protein